MHYRLISDYYFEIATTLKHSGYFSDQCQDPRSEAAKVAENDTPYTTNAAITPYFIKHYPFQYPMSNGSNILFSGDGDQPSLQRSVVIKRYLHSMRTRLEQEAQQSDLIQGVPGGLQAEITTIFDLNKLMTVNFNLASARELVELATQLNLSIPDFVANPENDSENDSENSSGSSVWRKQLIALLRTKKIHCQDVINNFVRQYKKPLQDHIELFFELKKEYLDFVHHYVSSYIQALDWRFNIVERLHSIIQNSNTPKPPGCCRSWLFHCSNERVALRCLQQIDDLMNLNLSEDSSRRLYRRCQTVAHTLQRKLKSNPQLSTQITQMYQRLAAKKKPKQTQSATKSCSTEETTTPTITLP